jgi:hypothetical protein
MPFELYGWREKTAVHRVCDAEMEKQIVGGDVIGRSGRVAIHEQSAEHIDEAEGADDYP